MWLRYRRRRGSARLCVRSGGAGVGTRRATRRSVQQPIGDGRVAVSSRYLCGQCGGGCRADGAIGAGGCSRSPCRRGVWPAAGGGATAGADGRNAAHERLQALAVVHVRAGDPQRHRKTVPVGDQVDLRSRLATGGRIRSRQRPPFAARTLTESIAHLDQSNSPRAPSSSRTTRCSRAHTRACDHCANRR